MLFQKIRFQKIFYLLPYFTFLIAISFYGMDNNGKKITHSESKKKVDSLREEHKKYVYNNQTKALKFINEGLTLADSIKYHSARIHCRIDLSYLHRVSGDYELALEYAFEALTKLKIILTEKNENLHDGVNTMLLAETNTTIGKTYADMTYYPLALKYFNKAEAIFKRHNDLKALAYLYMNKAIVYASNDEFEYGNVLFRKSLGVFKQLNDSASIGHAYNNLSMSYKQSENFSIAEKYNDSAIHIYKIVENKAALANALNNSARISYDKKQYGAALNSLDEALKVITEIGNVMFESENTTLRGMTNFQLGKSDLAERILIKELPNSRKHLYMENSESILETLVMLYEQKEDLRLLSKYKSMLLDLKVDKEKNQDKKVIIEEKYAKQFDEQADLFEFRENLYKKSNGIILGIFAFLAVQLVVLIILFNRKKSLNLNHT